MLSVACKMLFDVCCSLWVVVVMFCLLLVEGCLWFVCLLFIGFTVCCLLVVCWLSVGCLWLVVCGGWLVGGGRRMFVVFCRYLFVLICWLFGACWLLVVSRCVMCV